MVAADWKIFADYLSVASACCIWVVVYIGINGGILAEQLKTEVYNAAVDRESL